ncbi:phenylacetate-CoA oxygenase subunit PaaJ, partial [Streptomyces rochei]|nr:phenylacetate-CoA oxygenase subunit PaaJ [Streptomyces rochei]
VPLVLSPTRPAVPCPRCGSRETEETSRFAATSCKALWRCRSCREPFEYVKEI